LYELRGDVLSHITNLTPPPILKGLSHARKVSCHVRESVCPTLGE
jgi:hypothetical protein